MELELKLLLTPQAAASFRSHPLLEKYGTGQAREETLSATYYDTKECDLRRAGVGLRVRQSNGHWTQTMKAGGGVASGLHSRHEWESAVDGPAPDLAVLREYAVAEEHWQLLPDPALARGDCLLESERSRLDGRVETRLAAVVDAVLGLDEDDGDEEITA